MARTDRFSRLTIATAKRAAKAMRRDLGAVLSRTGARRSAKWVVSFRGERFDSKPFVAEATGRSVRSFSGGMAHLRKALARIGAKLVRLVVALISCSSSKLDTVAKAMDLYTGDFFRKARAYAERHCDRFAILSAKHGLLLADAMVAPYDERLSSRKSERAEWTAQVIRQVRGAFGGAELVLLAGADYREGLEASDLTTNYPMQGCRGLGDQKSWLKARA